MDLNQILAAASRMFPSANLGQVMQKAQNEIQGTPDTLSGVSAVAKRMGIDRESINSVFQRYGNTMQARAICSMLGTTPEALKSDAEKIVGGSAPSQPQTPPAHNRFPRLK